MASKIVEFIFEIKEEISDKLYLDLMNLLKKDFHQAKTVLDEQYEELTGYNTAGRATYIGLRFTY